MRATARICLAFAALAALHPVHHAFAVEVCGNGVDEDANNMTDEGCWPAGVTGLCESPLSCSVAGAVSPVLGALVYQFRPDVAFASPYGGDISFARVYTSQYNPGYLFPGATNHEAPLGYRFQHSYQSWVTIASGDPGSGNAKVVVHLPTGQDVMFGQTTGDANYYKFNSFQPGYHYKHLRRNISTQVWELQTLEGRVYEYASTGMLTKILPWPGASIYVSIEYQNGQVYRVKDASTYRYLQFEYFTTGTRLLQYVKLYENSATPELHLTVEFVYDTGDTKTKLTEVWIGGSKVETFSYDANGYLTAVTDENGKTQAALAYVNSAGKAARIGTPGGDIGYKYGDSGCDNGSGVFVYFNRKDTTACDADTDCGTGYYCGGETTPGTGDTGWCFEARRCVTVTAPNEHLVNTVTGSCSSCTKNEDYDWDTGVGNSLADLKGVQSSDGVWTSYLRNADGLVTKSVENDTDSDATTVPTGARVTYYKFDNTSYPGLVTEIRRLSELKPGGTCTDSSAGDCKRTILAYTSEGLLDTIQEVGFTYDSSHAVTGYDFTTDYNYDTNGRVTQVLGPRANIADDVAYTYWGAGNGLATGYRNEIRRTSDAQVTLVTALAEYSIWGRAKRVTDPDSTSTCRTYDSRFGLLATSRVVVNGSQTDCSQAAGSLDQTTTYTYDSARRRSKVTYPRDWENCFWGCIGGAGLCSSGPWYAILGCCALGCGAANIDFGVNCNGGFGCDSYQQGLTDGTVDPGQIDFDLSYWELAGVLLHAAAEAVMGGLSDGGGYVIDLFSPDSEVSGMGGINCFGTNPDGSVGTNWDGTLSAELWCKCYHDVDKCRDEFQSGGSGTADSTSSPTEM